MLTSRSGEVKTSRASPRRIALDGSGTFVRRLRAVELDGRHADAREAVHLVLHQRDERRDDDGEPAADDGGGLVAERLAAAGGQDDERVAAVEHGAHGLLLERPERGEAPVPLDRGAEFLRKRVNCGHLIGP